MIQPDHLSALPLRIALATDLCASVAYLSNVLWNKHPPDTWLSCPPRAAIFKQNRSNLGEQFSCSKTRLLRPRDSWLHMPNREQLHGWLPEIKKHHVFLSRSTWLHNSLFPLIHISFSHSSSQRGNARHTQFPDLCRPHAKAACLCDTICMPPSPHHTANDVNHLHCIFALSQVWEGWSSQAFPPAKLRSSGSWLQSAMTSRVSWSMMWCGAKRGLNSGWRPRSLGRDIKDEEVFLSCAKRTYHSNYFNSRRVHDICECMYATLLKKPAESPIKNDSIGDLIGPQMGPSRTVSSCGLNVQTNHDLAIGGSVFRCPCQWESWSSCSLCENDEEDESCAIEVLQVWLNHSNLVCNLSSSGLCLVLSFCGMYEFSLPCSCRTPLRTLVVSLQSLLLFMGPHWRSFIRSSDGSCRWSREVVVWATHGLPFRAPVYRACFVWPPPVRPRVQDDP